jgi:hypothetical protein
MTEPTGARPPSRGRTPMDVPVVTAEVADGAITPPDMAYVVDQLQRTCGEDAGRVRRARARLYGPDPSGVTFAEATLILTDGSTLSESGRGTTPRQALDAPLRPSGAAARVTSISSRRPPTRRGTIELHFGGSLTVPGVVGGQGAGCLLPRLGPGDDAVANLGSQVVNRARQISVRVELLFCGVEVVVGLRLLESGLTVLANQHERRQVDRFERNKEREPRPRVRLNKEHPYRENDGMDVDEVHRARERRDLVCDTQLELG